MDKQALIELVKSFGRFLWFGFLGLVVAGLTSLATSVELTSLMWAVPVLDVALPVGTYIVLGVGFVAKAIDRYIHESENTNSNGIAPKFLQG